LSKSYYRYKAKKNSEDYMFHFNNLITLRERGRGI